MPPNDWASPDCRARTPQLLDMLRKVEKRGVNENGKTIEAACRLDFPFRNRDGPSEARSIL